MKESKIAKLRVILDTEQDVYRDIEISIDSTLLHFHNAILDAFGWTPGEMASFFESDENWDKGKEYSLMDIGGDADMTVVKVEAIIQDTDSRAVYVYDFLRMWCFYVEIIGLEEGESPEYPMLAQEFGTAPDQFSKEVDFGDDPVSAPAEEEDSGPLKTGDPELDAYLAGEEDEEDNGPSFTSLDDLDDASY